MLEVINALRTNPQRPAIVGNNVTLSAQDVVEHAEQLAQQFQKQNIRRAALFADNGPAWIIADLASQLADICLLPLPLFFTKEQIHHCLQEAGVGHLLTNNLALAKSQISSLGEAWDVDCRTGILINTLQEIPKTDLPITTTKITFTSGTTGRPKGVCLSRQNMLTVSNAIIQATGITEPKHLCLLPLTTLLENIAGVYSPLLVGGQVVAPTLEAVGLQGSSQLDISKLLNAINTYQPNTLILIPQLLVALTTACEFGWQPPKSLQFIAVGGAHVADQLLTKARRLGLPVYEGYGLSECGSVVALNTPGQDGIGSCGQPLQHVSVSSDDGEIIINGNCFLGYTGDKASWYPQSVRTGDRGTIDEDGFVHINGRCKNVLISSFGRNINPEWPEAELLAGPLLSQCIVFGDAKPFCCAVLSPRDENTRDIHIQRWLDQVNTRLPDYAQIKAWYRLPEPLSVANGLLTDNGRPRRQRIYQQYSFAIESLYYLQEVAS